MASEIEANLIEKKQRRSVQFSTRGGGGGGADREGFTDGCVRLPNEQPDILDVIEIQPGVGVTSKGRLKEQPKEEDKNMSRAHILTGQIFNKYFGISIILDQNETLLLRENYELFAQLKCAYI